MKRIPALLTVALILAAPLARAAYFVDTNATTSVTTIAPKKPGDILIGKTGGTNTVWVSGAAGDTNAWIKVSN